MSCFVLTCPYRQYLNCAFIPVDLYDLFFLVRPWNRRPLELPDFAEQLTFADEAESVWDWSESES
jgi:hypothetical protein